MAGRRVAVVAGVGALLLVSGDPAAASQFPPSQGSSPCTFPVGTTIFDTVAGTFTGPGGQIAIPTTTEDGNTTRAVHCGTITIPAGATLRINGALRPELRAAGAVQIDGTIDVSATGAAPGPGTAALAGTSAAVDGGGSAHAAHGGQGAGGAGGVGSSLGNGGGGGGGGRAGGGGGAGDADVGGLGGGSGGAGGMATSGGGGAGVGTPTGAVAATAGTAGSASNRGGGGGGGSYGAVVNSSVEFMPGSGGGGGGGGTGAFMGPGAPGGTGGNGGGTLRVLSRNSISVGATGRIDANGRGGSPGTASGAGGVGGGGGGGSGGSIVLAAFNVSIASGGLLTASGGVGGTGGGPGAAGNGGNGGGGLVTIYSESFSGSNFMATTQGAGLQQKDYGALTLSVARAGAGTGTVTSAPAGISCGADCTELYDGDTVTLTATPAAGSTFAGWSGACTNATGDCVVQMTADRSVTATFEPVSEVPPDDQPPPDNGGSGSQTPTPPLDVALSAAKRQKIEKLQASVTCSRDCHVSLQASGKAGKRFDSRAAVADLAGGVPATIHLKLKRSVLRKVEGERGRATIAATATDQLGGQATAEATIKLKR